MKDNRVSREEQTKLNAASNGKKPYQKPAFRHERVFETLALSCGKKTSEASGCQFSTKTS
jgi:hypothetical protein